MFLRFNNVITIINNNNNKIINNSNITIIYAKLFRNMNGHFDFFCLIK